MKRKLFGMILCGGILLGTAGCGTKKLTCTTDLAGNEMEVTMEFKKNEVSKGKVTFIYKAENEEQAKQLKEEAEKNKNEDYKNYKVTVDGTNVKVSYEADTKDMNFENSSYDDVKKEAEEQGFTCK